MYVSGKYQPNPTFLHHGRAAGRLGVGGWGELRRKNRQVGKPIWDPVSVPQLEKRGIVGVLSSI